MEKDAESISTVQLKPDYAASEVYSTVSGSEPPPVSKSRSQIIISVHIVCTCVVAGESREIHSSTCKKQCDIFCKQGFTMNHRMSTSLKPNLAKIVLHKPSSALLQPLV